MDTGGRTKQGRTKGERIEEMSAVPTTSTSPVRNAVFGHLQAIQSLGPRLRRGSCGSASGDFDILAVVPRSLDDLAILRAAHLDRHRTKPNTLARRREVVERAEAAALALGWEWSAQDLTLLAEFAAESLDAEIEVDLSDWASPAHSTVAAVRAARTTSPQY
jgi:hypothetical protein